MKRFVALTAAVLMPVAAHAEGTVNVYNWSDYIGEKTVENFEKETGTKVNYDVFDSNEVLEAKLLAGGSGYDVVVPSGSFLERQIQAKVFQPIDTSKLANYGNLDEGIMSKIASHDPGNKYAVPYAWGTTGVGFNPALIAERLPDAPVGSWDLVFKPENAAKLADCGITMLDAPTELFDIALHYLGYSPDSTDKGEHEEAAALLESIRPYVRYFHSSQYINDLANGEVCISIGWSGDVFIAQARAEEAGQGVAIEYYIPSEGTVQWFDLMAIPADAPNPDAAHAFIDHMLKAEEAAAMTNYVWYANANKASWPLVDKEVLENNSIFPDETTLSNLFADKSSPQRTSRLRTRLWTKIKAGL